MHRYLRSAKDIYPLIRRDDRRRLGFGLGFGTYRYGTILILAWVLQVFRTLTRRLNRRACYREKTLSSLVLEYLNINRSRGTGHATGINLLCNMGCVFNNSTYIGWAADCSYRVYLGMLAT